jgi:hypothetical protein
MATIEIIPPLATSFCNVYRARYEWSRARLVGLFHSTLLAQGIKLTKSKGTNIYQKFLIKEGYMPGIFTTIRKLIYTTNNKNQP